MLLGGADAVLELPFPYSAAGAEFFGAAGVEILDRLGVDELWFGSECGNLSLLERAAALADSHAFQEQYAGTVGQSDGTAQVFFDLLQKQLELSTPFSSNDALGIAYLRAIRKQNASLRPHTVTRVGSGYREETAPVDTYPSAMAVRNVIFENGISAATDLLSPDTLRLLQEAEKNGTALADLKNAERWILGHLRLSPPTEDVAELTGGLLPRLITAAEKATSYEELLTLAATKKYPLSRLRRGILYALCDIAPEDLRTPPAYTRLLAANRVGCQFLAEQRKSLQIPVVTRNASLPQTAEAKRQAEWERRAYALYTLCLPTPKSPEALLKKNPIIR
jgi:predicted nucleotidyltransferase